VSVSSRPLPRTLALLSHGLSVQVLTSETRSLSPG
jgi:hypothetical protein